jgi:hypothetical protein
LRIASRLWLDRRAQIIEQVRIRFAQRPTTAGCQIQLLLNHDHLSYMESAMTRLAAA